MYRHSDNAGVFAVLLIAIMASSCTNSQKTNDGPGRKRADAAFIDGNSNLGLNILSNMLYYPGNESDVSAVIVKHPDMRNALLLRLREVLDKPSNYATRSTVVSGIIDVSIAIKNAGKAGIFTEADITDTNNAIRSLALRANHDNSIQFIISDHYVEVPGLSDQKEEQIIFARSVSLVLENKFDQLLLNKLFEYAKARGPGSSEYKAIAASLPSMPLTREHMSETVSKYMPEIAARMLVDMPSPLEQKCIGFGFRRGTDGMANCVMVQQMKGDQDTALAQQRSEQANATLAIQQQVQRERDSAMIDQVFRDTMGQFNIYCVKSFMGNCTQYQRIR